MKNINMVKGDRQENETSEARGPHTFHRGIAVTDADFVPYIPHDQIIPEWTYKAIIFGMLLSAIMAAANAYLGLYVGMTVSAAIPAAVMALAAFKALSRTGLTEDATILEVNLAKTMASAGEALAAGIVFTIPALIIIGSWDSIDILPTMGIAFVGGLLGVTFTIPLRRILINELDLPFPEGVACTEVLIAGEEGGEGANLVFSSLGLAMLWQFSRSSDGLNLWSPEYEKVTGDGKLRFFGGGELSAALIGVGYIIGLRIAMLMVMGGILGWVIILPVIGLLGEAGIYGNGWAMEDGTPVFGPSGFRVLWSDYLRYVGVGAMVVSAAYTLYTMRAAITTGLKNANPFSKLDEEDEDIIRTERDLSQKKASLVALLFIIPIFFIYYHFSENIGVSAIASVLMLISAFLFAAIAGYIAGLIGSSSNPISGITIATLLFVSIFLLIMGMEGTRGQTTAIGVAAVVCVAAAISGDVMQDLKTGQLVGNTPRILQLGEFVGVAVAAAVIPFVLYVLMDTYTLGVDLAAPQAQVMAVIVEGIFDGTMKWELVGLGMMIAVGIIAYSLHTGTKVPIMAVAIGLYLPIIMAVPILVGGLLKELSDRFIEHRVAHDPALEDDEEERESVLEREKKGAESKGVLFSSGLIAGEALTGIGIALIVWLDLDMNLKEFPVAWTGLLLFSYIALLLIYITLRDTIKDMSVREIWYHLRGAASTMLPGTLSTRDHHDREGYDHEGYGDGDIEGYQDEDIEGYEDEDIDGYEDEDVED